MKITEKFTHLVLIKESPWFLYETSEERALMLASEYEDASVVVAPEGLKVMAVKSKLTLVDHNVKLADHIISLENKRLLEEVLEEECLNV